MAHYFQGGYQPAAQRPSSAMVKKTPTPLPEDGNALAHGLDPHVLQQGQEGRRRAERRAEDPRVRFSEALRVLPWPSPAPEEAAVPARRPKDSSAEPSALRFAPQRPSQRPGDAARRSRSALGPLHPASS